MPKFPLEKVLDYRRHLRLERRNALAAALADERELVLHKQHVEQQREGVLGELTAITQSQNVDVAAAARRRTFVSRLELEIMILTEHIAQARVKVELARAELITADQDVKAIEKLKEKHVAEQTAVALKTSERELGEQWQAANWNW